MTSLSLAAVVQFSLLAAGATRDSYSEAHRINAETGRPLVILVGADWCPACRKMKNTFLPQVARRGLLRKVAFANVNTDREQRLAKRLTKGDSIPQLIMFRKTPNGWKRHALVGAQSPESIEKFINAGLRTADEKDEG